jgi:hypothetical protein
MTTTTPKRSRLPQGRRAGPAVPDVAGELRRLTPRDRWLIDLLHQHQTFSTEQIAAIGFDNLHTARNRLNLLAHRQVLAQFRDCIRPGSQSWRWTLGFLGAAYIAARDGTPTPRRATIADRVNRLGASPRLAHLLGVNAFFTDLMAHARHASDTRLDMWWPERDCEKAAGDYTRPDGFGSWTEHHRTLTFWLEYDRATEPAHRVLAKLDGYDRLHQAAHLDHAVLIRMQTARQEQSLHERLTHHPAVANGRLLVATMAAPPTTNPAAPVWLTPNSRTRLRLADLADRRAARPAA